MPEGLFFAPIPDSNQIRMSLIFAALNSGNFVEIRFNSHINVRGTGV